MEWALLISGALLYQLSSVRLWTTQLVADPEGEAAASPASLRTSSTGIAKWEQHNPCSSARQHKCGASPLCPDQPQPLGNKGYKCVISHGECSFGLNLLVCLSWCVVHPHKVVLKHMTLVPCRQTPTEAWCRSTAGTPIMCSKQLRKNVIYGAVYGMQLKLAWSKRLEIGAKERSLAPTVSLHRPAAVRSHCSLRKHGQRLQTLWLP